MNFDLRTKAAEFAGTAQEEQYKKLIKRNETEAKGIQDQIQGRNELNEKIVNALILGLNKQYYEAINFIHLCLEK